MLNTNNISISKRACSLLGILFFMFLYEVMYVFFIVFYFPLSAEFSALF